MTVRAPIYPKNQATGAGNDTATIIAELAASSSGDTIVLSNVDHEGGEFTPWHIALPKGQLADLEMQMPNNQSFDWYAQFMDKEDAGTVLYSAGISKTVTVRGVNDVNGITTIRQYATKEAFDIAVLEPSEGFSPIFLVQAPVSPRFESLKFQWIPVSLFTFSPFTVENCEFDGGVEAINPVLDDRYVFPHLATNPCDFSDMNGSLIKECAFTDCLTAMFSFGSGITVENCTFADFPANEIWDFYSAFVLCGDKDIWQSQVEDAPANLVVTKYCKQNVLRYNNIDRDTGEVILTGIGILFQSTFGGSEGITEDNEVYENTIANLGGFGVDFYTYIGSQTRRNYAYGNTFNKVQAPLVTDGTVMDDGTHFYPKDNVFTHNIIIDLAHAPASTFWGEKAPGAYLYLGQNCQVMKNDWTLSQVQPNHLAKATFSCGIILDSCSYCSVAEPPADWPHGGPGKYVWDINGHKNKVTGSGSKATTVELPAGICRYESSKLRQRKVAFVNRHR